MPRPQRGDPYDRSLYKTKTYAAWRAMRFRCQNPKSPNYEYYGARGIKVCDRWENSFGAFVSDMGVAPDGMQLDRWPDNNGNYEPSNCRWATPLQQCLNKRNNHAVNYNGEVVILSQLLKRLGHPEKSFYNKIRRRIRIHGDDVEKALSDTDRRVNNRRPYRRRMAKLLEPPTGLERKEFMLKKRNLGMSLNSIGELFGISGERVSQILGRTETRRALHNIGFLE